MTSGAEVLASYADRVGDGLRTGVPEADFVVAPETPDAAAEILRVASENRLKVLIWGGGTHQGYGYDIADAEIVLLTTAMASIIDWQPEDLTLVVGAGARVADMQHLLDEKSQTPVLPEDPGDATVGGVVAAGLSGYRRRRYGPTRDRMLEVVLATGDGRVVTGGGRLVKNVTGYDLPRLATGSLGAFGVISAVCLKLWPRASHEATVAVSDAAAASAEAYRPLAVLETEDGAWVYLGGTEQEVAGQAHALSGTVDVGLRWPSPPQSPHMLTMRVPPRSTAAGVRRVGDVPGARFVASHGVGEIQIGVDEIDQGPLLDLRAWAESIGGALVVARRPGPALIDPWGTPPPSLELQRSVKAAFDPVGIANPGRLPGGL